MFADPPEAGFLCQRFFQNRSAIDEYAIAERTNLGRYSVGQLLQARSQHLVIVAAERISGDIRLTVGIEQVGRRRLLIGQIIHARADDAQSARYQFIRPAAFLPVAGHILHFTVEAGFKPLSQAMFRRVQLDIGDAQLLKTELKAPCLDSLCEFSRI